eukprot:6196329-Pyramimonas_sp.AAC.1
MTQATINFQLGGSTTALRELYRQDIHHRDAQTTSSRHHGRHPPQMDTATRPRELIHGRRLCEFYVPLDPHYDV